MAVSNSVMVASNDEHFREMVRENLLNIPNSKVVAEYQEVAANLYIRVLLGVSVVDCNSGFRAWKRSTLEAIRVEEAFSPGPAIVQELLFKTARAGIGIAEVPIEFQNRLRGQSTLTIRLLLQGYVAVLKLRWMSLTGRI